MNAEIAIYLVQVLNLFAFSTIAVWYVVPLLRNISRVKALSALMCVHLGRTLCLQAYSSQDAGLKMSDVVRDNVVIGDLTGWALAIIILFLLQHRMKLSIALVWLLIIETFFRFRTKHIRCDKRWYNKHCKWYNLAHSRFLRTTNGSGSWAYHLATYYKAYRTTEVIQFFGTQ